MILEEIKEQDNVMQYVIVCVVDKFKNIGSEVQKKKKYSGSSENNHENECWRREGEKYQWKYG